MVSSQTLQFILKTLKEDILPLLESIDSKVKQSNNKDVDIKKEEAVISLLKKIEANSSEQLKLIKEGNKNKIKKSDN